MDILTLTCLIRDIYKLKSALDRIRVKEYISLSAQDEVRSGPLRVCYCRRPVRLRGHRLDLRHDGERGVRGPR